MSRTESINQRIIVTFISVTSIVLIFLGSIMTILFNKNYHSTKLSNLEKQMGIIENSINNYLNQQDGSYSQLKEIIKMACISTNTEAIITDRLGYVYLVNGEDYQDLMYSKIKLNTENSKVTLEEGTLTIKVANEKTVTTEITVDKKWFRADGTEFHPQDGEISYNLIQVLTTEGGESSEKIYKSGETLTSQDGWQKTYSNLPAADINGNGEKEICTYYVKEILIADYSTGYSNGSVGESEDPSAAALSSGTITVKNTEKMKFILPETGGTGRGILYIAGVFLLGISMILLGNKNSSFYECLHKKG